MDNITLTATCIFGVESILAKEIRQLGYEDTQVENGRVSFQCKFSDIPRVNINIRTAERILLKLEEFKAKTFDELFDNINNISWDKYLDKSSQFPVDVTSLKSKLHSVPACQSVAKKAVVEKLKSVYGMNKFPEDGELYKISVNIMKDTATVYIDTSGTGLHKRGYRKLTGQAPLKETLAASMILLTRWKKDRSLFDPMCGTGTIPIETALIGKNIAPGINRKFVSYKWRQIKKRDWDKAYEEAKDAIDTSVQLDIQGTDIDEKALRMALYHAEQANVSEDIHFQKRDFKEISSSRKYGFIICNPPYGERIGEKKEVESMYRDMGKVFNTFPTWSKYILTPQKNFESLYGKKANKRRKLYNGTISCTYYQFFGKKPPKNL